MIGGILQKRLGHGVKIGHSGRQKISRPFYGPHLLSSVYGLWILMTDLIVFDKDGVILDLEATWLPVARAVAHYTASRIPDDWDGDIGGVELLAAIGVDEAAGQIDSRGIFAAGSFADIRSCWQKMLPNHMIKLDQDDRYKQEVQILVDRHGRNQTVPKGEVEAPLRQLHKDGYQLAILTNDSESSAKRNMQILAFWIYFVRGWCG